MNHQFVYGLAALFGLTRSEVVAVAAEIVQRYIQPVFRIAEELAEAIQGLPEIPSYEKLLREKCGYGPLRAKIMAHQIRHWGANQAAEFNEGRKLRTIIDRMAAAEDQSTLVLSGRAKSLQAACRNLEARNVIDSAIEKAGLTLTAAEFRRLIELACERDEAAGRELARTSRRMSPHLPDARGRPISIDTCTHLFLQRQLESCGHECAFTSSTDSAGFTDPVTRATQLASGNGAFSPLHARKLRKSNRLPPVLRVDLLTAERQRAAQAARLR